MTAVVFAGGTWAADQTIFGAKAQLKDRPGIPGTRRVDIKAKDVLTPGTLVGDPATNGATVTVITQGGTPVTQTFTLAPNGILPYWKRYPSDTLVPAVGWTYKDKYGANSAVTALKIKIKPGSSAQLQVKMYDKLQNQPLNVVPPNPGTYVGLSFTITGGDTYCVNLGGAAGGYYKEKGAYAFYIKKPVSEATCPDPSAVCGDNVASPPNETCDGTDDAACPGLCGVNLPCQCPICGDGSQDAGEDCDQLDLGICTEGCSFACTCTTCGDGVAEPPGESCDGADDLACPGLCLPPGNVNQCQCPMCGDNDINQGTEQCDGTADAACPGLCVEPFGPTECMCPVCGNDIVEPGEPCDGTDSGSCPGDCGLTGGPNQCVCAVCGDNEVNNSGEECDGTDDVDCPGVCDVSCLCP